MDQTKVISDCFISYEVVLNLRIKSCYKNRMITRVITLLHVYVTSLTTSMSTTHFLTEIVFITKAIKFHFNGSYDKQKLSLVVVLYEI